MSVYGKEIKGNRELVHGKGPEIDPHDFMVNGRIDEPAFYAALGAAKQGLVKAYRITNQTGGLAGFVRYYDAKGKEIQVFTSFDEIKAANKRRRKSKLQPMTYGFGEWEEKKQQAQQPQRPATYAFGAWEPDYMEM